jgi:ABC-type nitrate/sulfonate/bicarbonate transport system substrate-binding protein
MTRTLRLTTFSEPSALLAAQYRGFLEEVGLVLDVEYPKGSRSQMEGLLAGQWDLAHTNADNVMKFRAYGHTDLFIFLALDRGIAQKLVAQPQIEGWNDLRGGPVGVDAPDSGYAFVVYEMLRRNGLERDDYEVRPIGATVYRLRALQNGEINAGLLSHHHETTALDDGMHILGDTRDYFAAHAGVTAAATAHWTEHNDETLHNYTRAMLAAARWVQDPANHEQVVRVVAEGRNIDEDRARRVLTIEKGARTGTISSVDDVERSLAASAALRSAYTGTEPTGYFDAQYMRAALASSSGGSR